MTTAESVSLESLNKEICDVLAGHDLHTTSLKVVRAEVETRLGLGPGGLDSRKADVKELTTKEINRIQAAEEEAAGAFAENNAPDATDSSIQVAAVEPRKRAAENRSNSSAPPSKKGSKAQPEVTAESVSLESLNRIICDVLAGEDLHTTSLKVVRAKVEERLGLGPGMLDSRKADVKELTTKEISRIQAAEEEATGASSGNEAQDAADSSLQIAAVEPRKRAAESRASSSASAVKKGSKAQPEETALVQKEKPKGAGKGSRARQISIMTRKEFLDHAEQFSVQLGDKLLKVPPRKFSTGSMGFYGNQKIVMDVGGQSLTMQCAVNCIVIGSKEWSDE